MGRAGGDVLKINGHPTAFPAPQSTAIWSDAAVWVPWALWQASLRAPDGRLDVQVTLPEGVTAEIDLPGAPLQYADHGRHHFTGAGDSAAAPW